MLRRCLGLVAGSWTGSAGALAVSCISTLTSSSCCCQAIPSVEAPCLAMRSSTTAVCLLRTVERTCQMMLDLL